MGDGEKMTDDEENQRGIPEAEFIEDVAQHLVKFDGNAESSLKLQNELYGKYKFLESSLVTQQAHAEAKQPEIEKTLAMIRKLKAAKEAESSLDTHYLLSDNCYAKAKVTPNDQVCLWLGANIMVEYSYGEAITLLEGQLENNTSKIAEMKDTLSFLKDQITTTEVNIARIYNADVRRRKEQERKDGEVAH